MLISCCVDNWDYSTIIALMDTNRRLNETYSKKRGF